MTCAEILADLYRDLNFDPTPPTAVTTRLRSHLNKAHTAILREPSLSRLRDTLQPLTFASVADRQVYGLPSHLSRVYAITERDNDRRLTSMSLEELRATDPGLTSTGTPSSFVMMGHGPTQAVPASTGIWAVSSSASDSSQSVLLNGVRSGGLPSGDVATTLTGTTRVALGTFDDYVDVQSLSLSAVGVGLISFYDAAASGNLLAQIAIGATYPRYLRILLYPTPESAITYYVDGQLAFPVLDDNQDIPMIPEEFHDILPAYARMREYERLGDLERSALASKEYEKGLARMKHMIGTSPAETMTMAGRSGPTHSRMGAWTPAGSGW